MFVNETFVNIDIFIYKADMPRKLTTEDFIMKAKLIHGDKYDYSLVKYHFNNEKIEIRCLEHGLFKQLPNSHLSGKGCLLCGEKERIKKQSLTKEEFLNKARVNHGDKYDYSIVEYKNNKTKVKIRCDKHGVFELKPNCHLTGGGCPRCVGRGKTTEDFINESNLKHNHKYDYSLVNYHGTHNRIDIICPQHGIFKQTPNNHLSGGGCPVCNFSVGENQIKEYLTNNKIDFIHQKRFSDCRHIRPLPFDFYLQEFNLCIEYQGIQHFEPINYYGGLKNFLEQQNRDKIKKNYCENNKIELCYIKYDEDVNDRLNKILLKHVC
jgi:hypothetical protein